jgi:hypothetical protein
MVPVRDPAGFRESDAGTVASSFVSTRSACSQELRDKLAARSTELQFSAVTFYGKYCPQTLCLAVSSTLNNGCSRYLLATWLLNLWRAAIKAHTVVHAW